MFSSKTHRQDCLHLQRRPFSFHRFGVIAFAVFTAGSALSSPSPVRAQSPDPGPSAPSTHSPPALPDSVAQDGLPGSAPAGEVEPPPLGFDVDAQGAIGAVVRPVPLKAAPTFQENFTAGLQMSRQGAHREAIEKFRAAYANKPLPVLYLYLGLSYQKLGIIKVAVGYYRLYLRFESNIKAEIRTEVESYIKEQQSRLDEEERAMRAVRESGGDDTAAQAASGKESGRPAPTVSSTAPQQLLVSGARDTAGNKPAVPLVKRWWFWGSVGLVSTAVVAGAVAGTRPRTPEPPAGVVLVDLPWQ